MRAMMKNFFDVRTPFMRPLWRRAAFTAAVGIWGSVELLTPHGNWGFGVIFVACAAYLAHQYFWAFDPDDYAPKDKSDGDS